MQVIIAIFIVFIVSGCVEVNVVQQENGKTTDTTKYYPFSKRKDIKRWEGITPLHLAAYYNHTGTVKQLLQKGADPFSEAKDPVQGADVTPFELAALLKNEETAKFLSDYMLRHYRSLLLRDQDKLIRILAPLWHHWPLYTLELVQRYDYKKMVGHVLKKLTMTRKYQGRKGCVELVREIVMKGYANALKPIAKASPKCVHDAFQKDIKMLIDNYSLTEEVDSRIKVMKLYKPYVGANAYKEVTQLQKRLQNDIEKRNSAIRKTLSEAFASSTTHRTEGVKIRFIETKGNSMTYELIFDNHADGIIYATRKNDHYNIGTYGGKYHRQLLGDYFPDLHEIYTTVCGSKKRIGTLEEALRMIAYCSYKGYY